MRDAVTRLVRGVRRLASAPGFSAAAVLALALGIGANVAVFSVVESVLIQPLPYTEPERLVGVWHTAPGLGFDQVNMSPALYFVYREQARAFADIAIWDDSQSAVTGLEQPEQVESMMVTDGLFPLLGVGAEIGRVFSAEDDRPGAPLTVMLGYGYWQRRFGGDPAVIGETLTVDGRPREIIGVAPRGFRLMRSEPALYFPAQWDPAKLFLGNFSYQAIARLADGATIEQANAEMARLVPVAAERYSEGLSLGMLEEAGFAPAVHPLEHDVVGDIGQVLWVLLGTVGLVLLIACANVANLFLVRAEARQREMAVRSALGATRLEVAVEYVVESLLLALAGGLAGLGLAFVGVRLLVALGPATIPRLHEIGVHPPALLFALFVSLGAGLLFGLAPLLRGQGGPSAGVLGEGRGGATGRERHRLRHALVVTQVALALVLLVASGLMLRSFRALQEVEPGFTAPEQVQTFRLIVPRAEVEDPLELAALWERLVERIGAVNGVDAVGASFALTMDGYDSNDAVVVEGFPVEEDTLPPIRRYKWITPGYFSTMGNPLLAGREPTWADIHAHARVAVITRNLALEYWSSPQEAIGKRLRDMGAQEQDLPWYEVIGVVGDVRDDGLGEPAPKVVYWPLIAPGMWGEELLVQRTMAFAVRSRSRSPDSLLPELRQAVWSERANLPLANVRTLQEILDRSLARSTFTMLMLAIAAAVALALGIIGIYGVITYLVTLRTREIGVRMALGARRRAVSAMMVRLAFVLVVLGVAIGVLAALGLTRLMSSLLFGVGASDPATFVAVAALLVAVALVASSLAALRAARVDPIVALRLE